MAPLPDAVKSTDNANGITIIPTECCNLSIIDHVSPTRVVVEINKTIHNYFAGWFDGLPVGQPVTIGLSMEGKGNVSKWNGLSPVLTYANPNAYEAYEWFAKDDKGRWISSDIGKSGEEKYAGTDIVPLQHVIPKELARDFLSPDGKYWFPWREITGEALPQLNIFRMTFQCAYPSACVAMRVPYTYNYQQSLLGKIKAARYPGVFVDDIGFTTDLRKLRVIRVEDQNHPVNVRKVGEKTSSDGIKIPVFSIEEQTGVKPDEKHRVFVILAGEHSTEPAGSWAVEGVLRALLSNTPEAMKLRKNTTWLLIPIQDLDGRARSTFDALTMQYYNHQGIPGGANLTPTEVIAQISYLRTFIESGRPIVLSATWHNVECNEGMPVFSPYAIAEDWNLTVQFNREWFARLNEDTIKTGNAIPLAGGQQQLRLYGWLGSRYGALALAFEVNDRYPTQHSSLWGIEHIGESFASYVTNFFDGDIGQHRVMQTKSTLAKRKQEKDMFLRQNPTGEFEMDSLITRGY